MIMWQTMISSASRTRYIVTKLKQTGLSQVSVPLVSHYQSTIYVSGIRYFCDRCKNCIRSPFGQKGRSVLNLLYKCRIRTGLAPYSTALYPVLRANGVATPHMHGISPSSLISKCKLSDNGKKQGHQEMLLKDDPELKTLISELADDFAVELQSRRDHEANESSDSASSDSDSSESEDERGESTSFKGRSLLKFDSENSIEDLNSQSENCEYEDFFGLDDNLEETEEDYDPAIESPIPLERGLSGVFDLDDLVTLLHSENAMDVCVIAVTPHLAYVDYLVIVTGRSTRHLNAIAQYVKYLYKKRRGNQDPKSVKIEGENTSHNWLAMDLGNIALHLFLEETRTYYDLESLWTLGEEFDLLTKDTEKDKFATYLNELGLLGVLDEPDRTFPSPPVSGEQSYTQAKKSDKMRKFRPVFHGLESVAGWNQAPGDDSEKQQ